MSAIKQAAFVLFLGMIPVSLQTSAYAAESTQNKNITFIEGKSSADGSSELRRELIQDCILSLPNPDSVEPQMTSEALYLKEVNGATNTDGWAKSYTAKLEINYLTSEKELLVITTRSVQGQQPIIKEVDKTLRHSQEFVSDPTEGGTYAGQSHRQYYFTNAADAKKDVRERARIWIQQQKPVLCRIK